MTWDDSSLVLKFDIQNSKWYPSYSDVQGFESMMQQFDGTIEGYCTEFVRIGEDDADVKVETTGISCEYYLRVSREIVCNI